MKFLLSHNHMLMQKKKKMVKVQNFKFHNCTNNIAGELPEEYACLFVSESVVYF